MASLFTKSCKYLYLRVSMLLSLCYIGIRGVYTSPPNIIFILADDLGWDDVGFHGAEYATPNIDRLAGEGVILNNYYVQPMCTPTRGAILTGKYPIHTGLQHYVIAGSQPYGLPLSEVTLAQHLQTLGYSTRAIGKWHLGFFKQDYLPENRGFDSHYGYYLGRGDYFDHYAQDGGFMGLDLHDNGQPVWNETQVYSTDLFTKKAVNTITSHNKTKPLFLYLAYQAVHAGNDGDTIQVPQKYINRFPYIKNAKRRMFAGVASALDDSVGTVYKALQDSGMAENSIIIFSTDNGGPSNSYDGNAACNWPLRGTKNTLWQGGVRGVGFVHGPLMKQRAYINNNLIHAVDWLPTLLSLASGDSSLPGGIDGINQWESISEGGPTQRKEVLLNIDPIAKQESLILANYKLIFGNISDGKNDGWYPPSETNVTSSNSHSLFFEPQISSSNPNLYSKQTTNRRISSLKIEEMSQTQVETLVKILTFFYQELTQKSSNYKKYQESSLSIKKMSADSEGNETQIPITKNMERQMGTFNKMVDCGTRPINASTNCQPLKAPCLFDIQNDPCEFYNLAESLPVIVDVLAQRLQMYRSTMVPPANKPIDPSGDPSLHGGAWGPWL